MLSLSFHFSFKPSLLPTTLISSTHSQKMQDLQNNNQQQQLQTFDHTNPDDFLDQMLNNLPSSWPELPPTPKSPWDLNSQNPNLFNNRLTNPQLHYHHDESALLASRLRHHQITTPVAGAGIGRTPSGPTSLPGDALQNGDGSVPGLFNGLSRSQQFHDTQNGSTQNFGNGTAGVNQGGSGGNGGVPPVKQRVRARRGQATDPHSIAERLRRERIAERMKGLQELVPNANKTDKASMLDEIIDYVKFLQLQVKVLSMSRLGGAGAVAPLVADISSEGGGDSIQASRKGRSSNGAQTASTNNGTLTVTEHQVAKLMEEDMGSAMQYLQGKGLCLMPISLATAISTATCNSRIPKNTNPFFPSALDGPSSPSLSVLTVQSATMANGVGEASLKDATSVSKP